MGRSPDLVSRLYQGKCEDFNSKSMWLPISFWLHQLHGTDGIIRSLLVNTYTLLALFSQEWLVIHWLLQVEYPLSQMPKMGTFSDLEFFFNLGLFTYIHNEIFGGWDWSRNIYIYLIHTAWKTFYIFLCFWIECSLYLWLALNSWSSRLRHPAARFADIYYYIQHTVLCVHMCSCLCTGVCVCMYVEARGQWWVSYWLLSTSFFDTRSLAESGAH